MLQGYSTPSTPKGESALVPSPPWHNVDVTFAFEYWADPDVCAAFLPPGFTPCDDPGYCIAQFAEWHTVTDGGLERADPGRGQYQEMFLLLGAQRDAERVFTCPFMYVDDGINLTRSYPMASLAAGAREPGGQLAATMSFRGHRVVNAAMTLTGLTEEPFGLAACKVFGVRHFSRPNCRHRYQHQARAVRRGALHRHRPPTRRWLVGRGDTRLPAGTRARTL